MPSKVPQPHNQKKKGRSIQEKRADKKAKSAGLAAPGLRLTTRSDRTATTHDPGGH